MTRALALPDDPLSKLLIPPGAGKDERSRLASALTLSPAAGLLVRVGRREAQREQA